MTPFRLPTGTLSPPTASPVSPARLSPVRLESVKRVLFSPEDQHRPPRAVPHPEPAAAAAAAAADPEAADAGAVDAAASGQAYRIPEFGPVFTQDPSSYEEFLSYQLGVGYGRAEARGEILPNPARRPLPYPNSSPGGYKELKALQLGVLHGHAEVALEAAAAAAAAAATAAAAGSSSAQ